MENGVFQQRLNQQLRNLFILHRLIAFKHNLKAIIISETLNLHILTQYFKLIPDFDKFIRIGQCAAQKLDKGCQHLGGLPIFFHIDHTFYGKQRVIHKVRIDLSLQKAQLHLPFLFFLLFDAVHQAAHAPQHQIQAVA